MGPSYWYSNSFWLIRGPILSFLMPVQPFSEDFYLGPSGPSTPSRPPLLRTPRVGKVNSSVRETLNSNIRLMALRRSIVCSQIEHSGMGKANVIHLSISLLLSMFSHLSFSSAGS